jgi:acyl-CoA thioesterase
VSVTVTTAETDPRYGNMIGPFGGWIAAALLRPILAHPERLGEPLSITIDFAAAIRDGSFEVHVEPLKINRSTSFWAARLVQDHDGVPTHCASANAVFAVRRATPHFSNERAPVAPPPESVPRDDRGRNRAKWMDTYDMRFVSGNPFATASTAEPHTIAWVRDLVSPTLDFASLLALCDCAFPQLFHRIGRFVPVSTVSMTVHFHAASSDLAAVGDDFIVYDATMRTAYDGFFDEVSLLYSRAGTMLATMQQMVWFSMPNADQLPPGASKS